MFFKCIVRLIFWNWPEKLSMKVHGSLNYLLTNYNFNQVELTNITLLLSFKYYAII